MTAGVVCCIMNDCGLQLKGAALCPPRPRPPQGRRACKVLPGVWAMAFIVGMSDFLVFGSGLALWLYALQQRSLPWLASLTAMKGVASAGWLVTALTVSTTHLMYAFIWYNPKKFTSICARPPLRLLGDHPVDIFHHLVIFLKALQQLAAATLFAGGSMTTLVSMIAATSATEWGVMMVLMAVGQLLNAAIYKAMRVTRAAPSFPQPSAPCLPRRFAKPR